LPDCVNVPPDLDLSNAEKVDLMDDFIYLEPLISHDGGSEAEILRRIMIARECFSLLKKNI